MPFKQQGRPGSGVSLFFFAVGLGLLATPAAACPSGAKCMSLNADGRFVSSDEAETGARFVRAPQPLAPER